MYYQLLCNQCAQSCLLQQHSPAPELGQEARRDLPWEVGQRSVREVGKEERCREVSKRRMEAGIEGGKDEWRAMVYLQCPLPGVPHSEYRPEYSAVWPLYIQEHGSVCMSCAGHQQVTRMSCASHVHVMCMSCASHVHDMCKSCACHVQVLTCNGQCVLDGPELCDSA